MYNYKIRTRLILSMLRPVGWELCVPMNFERKCHILVGCFFFFFLGGGGEGSGPLEEGKARKEGNNFRFQI